MSLMCASTYMSHMDHLCGSNHDPRVVSIHEHKEVRNITQTLFHVFISTSQDFINIST